MWCKITTLDKGNARGVFRAPWDMTYNITTYEQHLDKAQLKCADMGVKTPNSEKVQIYVQQMYGAKNLTEKEFIEWEVTKEEDKTWAKAKTYFGALYRARRSYESDMKENLSSFETAHSLTKNPPNGSESNTTERNADTAATKAKKNCPPTNE